MINQTYQQIGDQVGMTKEGVSKVCGKTIILVFLKLYWNVEKDPMAILKSMLDYGFDMADMMKFLKADPVCMDILRRHLKP